MIFRRNHPQFDGHCCHHRFRQVLKQHDFKALISSNYHIYKDYKYTTLVQSLM